MTPVLLGLAAAAGLACPARMWWRARHGRKAACCMRSGDGGDAAAVRRRQETLRAQLLALGGEAPSDVDRRDGYAVARELDRQG